MPLPPPPPPPAPAGLPDTHDPVGGQEGLLHAVPVVHINVEVQDAARAGRGGTCGGRESPLCITSQLFLLLLPLLLLLLPLLLLLLLLLLLPPPLRSLPCRRRRCCCSGTASGELLLTAGGTSAALERPTQCRLHNKSLQGGQTKSGHSSGCELPSAGGGRSGRIRVMPRACVHTTRHQRSAHPRPLRAWRGAGRPPS